MKVFVFVSKDLYELPLAVADSITELAKMVGKNPDAVYSAMYKAKKRGSRCRYKTVDIPEENYHEQNDNPD